MMIAYQLQYEAMPSKKYHLRKDKEVGKNESVAKVRKVYEKSRTEHIKDIVIAVLIVGVVSFMLGVHYADSQHSSTQKAVQAAVNAKTVTSSPKGQ